VIAFDSRSHHSLGLLVLGVGGSSTVFRPVSQLLCYTYTTSFWDTGIGLDMEDVSVAARIGFVVHELMVNK